MILLDYSQIVIASCLAHGPDMDKGKDAAKKIDIIRHSTLASILRYKEQYGAKFGEIVLCADGGNYWRKDQFPQYKAHRKASREESATDWETIFTFAKEFLSDLSEVFPYPTVRVNGAEGDDVIAVLAEWGIDNKVITTGLIDEPEPTLIVSSDGDFKQLHKHKNIKQWSPIQKKWVSKPEKDFLFNKIVQGDKGDGVPNVRMGDSAIVDGTRQLPITEKVIEKFKDPSKLTEIEKRNFHRNQMLIDFDYIPKEVRERIVDAYLNNNKKRDLNAIMQYLMKHRCRVLLNDLQSF